MISSIAHIRYFFSSVWQHVKNLSLIQSPLHRTRCQKPQMTLEALDLQLCSHISKRLLFFNISFHQTSRRFETSWNKISKDTKKLNHEMFKRMIEKIKEKRIKVVSCLGSRFLTSFRFLLRRNSKKKFYSILTNLPWLLQCPFYAEVIDVINIEQKGWNVLLYSELFRIIFLRFIVVNLLSVWNSKDLLLNFNERSCQKSHWNVLHCTQIFETLQSQRVYKISKPPEVETWKLPESFWNQVKKF